MYENELKGLEYISSQVGQMPDMVQGGGGNTSAKLDENLMAVKASGFMLKQVTAQDGYVVINYKDLKTYFSNVDLNSGIDYEKDSVEFAKKSIVRLEGQKELRPSVEAGFHSMLKKYVIHSHAVYANILCCSRNGRELVDKMFAGKNCEYLWIPYINPGFSLTLSISDAIAEHMKKGGKFPEVVFMENHGVIVTGDDAQKCVELHTEVNSHIKAELGLPAVYPEIRLKEQDENTFISETAYLKDFFKGTNIDAGYFDRIVLYPDQLVYLNGNIAVNREDAKLNINTADGRIVYKTGAKEARTMEETLLAYIYVIDMIEKCKLPLKTMSEEEINFIRNWESERYRKSLVK